MRAMTVDESGAPWPYDPAEEHDDEGLPVWACPEGICECHPPSGDAEKASHRLVLFDHEAMGMPGARCRVIENGKVVNIDAPYADGPAASPSSSRERRARWRSSGRRQAFHGHLATPSASAITSTWGRHSTRALPDASTT